MKKSVLALSISAAVLGLGFAGGAQAVVTVAGGNANGLLVSDNGVGHIVIVPYYTAQGANHTLINLVNTDTQNGKAVKVRFRGAANSDDVFDFQVFLSPGDVWAGDIAQQADGRAKLTTTDTSCTKPDLKDPKLNTGFITHRLDQSLTASEKAAQTREGYIEILNMGDIPTGSKLAGSVFHSNGKALCSGAPWTALDDRLVVPTATATVGMLPPTTGLMANWTIVNVTNQAAWAAAATALVALNTTGPAKGNVVYWPQTVDPVIVGTMTSADAYTADPLLIGAVPYVFPSQFDLPDLSTPYLYATETAPMRARDLTATIATTVVQNEFLTTPGILAATDWVFAQPTRRYHVVINPNDKGHLIGSSSLYGSYYSDVNTFVSDDGSQACIRGLYFKPYNREEVQPPTVAVSPGVVPSLCGEVSVLSFNNAGKTQSGVIEAALTLKDIEVGSNEGWLNVQTPGLNIGGVDQGMPILGHALTRAQANPTSYFGANYQHRTNLVKQVTIYPR